MRDRSRETPRASSMTARISSPYFRKRKFFFRAERKKQRVGLFIMRIRVIFLDARFPTAREDRQSTRESLVAFRLLLDLLNEAQRGGASTIARKNRSRARARVDYNYSARRAHTHSHSLADCFATSFSARDSFARVNRRHLIVYAAIKRSDLVVARARRELTRTVCVCACVSRS